MELATKMRLEQSHLLCNTALMPDQGSPQVAGEVEGNARVAAL